MGRRMGMRVGKRVGGVRVSAGRGGVRVGSGKQYGHARVGVSYSSRGGLGGGASYGTNSARIGTNGHGVSAGVTGKTGPVSYGFGYGMSAARHRNNSSGHGTTGYDGMDLEGAAQLGYVIARSFTPWWLTAARKLTGRAS